ncbi:MAG: hypothetical protein HYY44_06890, partial [Deltaproteobacteria bacterium]|nr:hypothetical protein [Deltaproteobacteria bacterium]
MRGQIWPVVIGFLLLSMSSEIQAEKSARTPDTTFWIVSAGLVMTTIYDLETTFWSLKNCDNCKEGNFLVAPLVNTGRPATYAVMMGVNAGLLYLSYRVKKQGSKLWWIGPAIGTAAHGVAGTLN